MNQDRIARATLTQIVEPGESIASALIAAVGPEAALAAIAGSAHLSPTDRAAVGNRLEVIDPSISADIDHALLRYSTRTESKTLASLQADGERFLAQIEKLGGGFLIPEDDAWPDQVNDLPVPPIGLWYRGDISQGIPTPQKAIVFDGSRDSTAYGAAVTGELAYSAAQAGISVITGAGYGVASHALRSAMAGSTGNMAVIAVLACGVDRFYPAGNTDLLQAVAQNGLILSELAPGMAPTRYRFLSRNRILAALAGATVIAEARWRSGALNTAHHAGSLGRAIGAVPGSIHAPNSAGCHRLLREGGAVCVADSSEVLELLN